MLDTAKCTEYLKKGFKKIWELLKTAATGTWEMITSCWPKICESIYGLLNGWARRVDRLINKALTEAGVSKD